MQVLDYMAVRFVSLVSHCALADTAVCLLSLRAAASDKPQWR